MATVIGRGSALWFDFREDWPIDGLPPGKVRIRLRPGCFAKIYVRTATGAAEFILLKQNGRYEAMQVARNISYENTQKTNH